MSAENRAAATGVGARHGRKWESNKQAASKANGYRAAGVASTSIETRLAALRTALAGVPTGSPAASAYESAIRRLSTEGGAA